MIASLNELSPAPRRQALEFLQSQPAELRDDLMAHLLETSAPTTRRPR